MSRLSGKRPGSGSSGAEGDSAGRALSPACFASDAGPGRLFKWTISGKWTVPDGFWRHGTAYSSIHDVMGGQVRQRTGRESTSDPLNEVRAFKPVIPESC